jgi:tetratricopeptide (TPR) repeat protein
MKQLVIIVMLFSFKAALAATPLELLNDANEAYKRSEYVYAAEKYELILQQDMVSAELYYNLGNAYYKSNQIGPAILNYERARQLKPLDEDIRHNLSVARSRTVDRIEERPKLFYERWFMASWSLQSLDGWAVTIIVLLVLFLSVTSLYLFSRTIMLKKISFYTMILLFLMVGLSSVSARKQYKRLNTEKEAIVMHQRVSAKSSPSPQSPDLFLMHEGTKVSIRNTLGLWHEISLPNGNVGWIKAETLEVI